MRRPALEEISQVAEIIAAVAVVVSLVYVARELRSNTASVRAASMQAVASESGESLRMLAADSTLARIVRVGREDLSALTPDEAYRFGVWSRQRWLTLQNVYFQNELGVFDRRVWEGYLDVICTASSYQGAQTDWLNHRAALDEGFVALVDACP